MRGEFMVMMSEPKNSPPHRRVPAGCGMKGRWLLHHNFELAHIVLLIRQCLGKYAVPTPPQTPCSPYSPDLSPPDFLYSLNSKLPSKGYFRQWKTSLLQ
jgi:hypothetical protein